jgi:hypothetical protein
MNCLSQAGGVGRPQTTNKGLFGNPLSPAVPGSSQVRFELMEERSAPVVTFLAFRDQLTGRPYRPPNAGIYGAQ